MYGNIGICRNQYFFRAETEEIAKICVRKWQESGVMPVGEFSVRKYNDELFVAELQK